MKLWLYIVHTLVGCPRPHGHVYKHFVDEGWFEVCLGCGRRRPMAHGPTARRKRG